MIASAACMISPAGIEINWKLKKKRPMTPPNKRDEFLVRWVGSAFGLGLSPVVPGTFGALLGLFIHAVIVILLAPAHHLIAVTVMMGLMILANHVLTPLAESYWKVEDPPHFVLDEVAGYLVVPFVYREPVSWTWMLLGFFLFRVYDVFKLIAPARLVDEQLKGPWAILLDDVISGACAGITLYLFSWCGLNFLLY